MITVKIDVTKVEKERLFPGKNGAKYLDLILIPTPDDRYGNTHMVVQSVSKEERLAGKKGPILGNAKELGGGQSRPQTRPASQQRRQPENLDEDIPFSSAPKYGATHK